MSLNVLPYPRFRAWTSNNTPLAGGKLYTYEPGTTTPKAVFQDTLLTTPHTNPVVLDANGEALIYTSGKYKYVLDDASDVQVWEEDNIGDDGSPIDGEWVITKAANYASATSFTVSGDVTTDYHKDRPVRAVGAVTGTIYGEIVSSVFSVSATTVTVVWRSGSLSNESVSVSVGILSSDIGSAALNYYPQKSWETGVQNPIYRYGDIRRFGASTSETAANNTTAIQNAHDSSVAADDQFNEVIFPAGQYSVNALTWSPLVTGRAEGKVVLKTGVTSGTWLHISTEHGNWDSVPDQIPYAGNKVFDGYFVFENTAGKGANTATGIWFGDDNATPQNYSAESITLDGIRMSGWDKSMRFGSHAYLITFKNSTFRDNVDCIYLDDTPYIDRLERVAYDNCTFANSTYVLNHVANVGGDLVFNNCSFDYNDYLSANVTSTLILNFTGGCHFEWNSSNTYIAVNGGVVNLSDYYVFYSGGTPPSLLLAGVGANGHLKSFGATFNTPSGNSIFGLSATTAEITCEVSYKQFGGGTSYIDNSGGGKINGYVDSLGTSGYTKHPNGFIEQWGTIPTTAVGINASVTVTVTFPLAFPTACTHATATGQPSGSADFYGLTQRIITGTPLTTTQFAFRNGAAAQNIINATYYAVGY